MDVGAVRGSPIGVLLPIEGWDPRFDERYEHEAFVPAPLPTHVELSAPTHASVLAASTAVARVDQAASLLPYPMLLARPAIRREAVSTSALEGTYAALSEVLEAEFMDPGDVSTSVSEVRNYVEAAEGAYASVREGRPVTLGFLSDLQKVLVRGTRSDGASAGRVRTTQVFIGAEGRRIPESRFVPPPPDHNLTDGLDAWETWIHSRLPGLPVVARMAMAHYQFEALHPFVDGNGRLGRLVAILQLLQSRELRVPIINLSPWLEHRRSEYQDGLLRVSVTGEWDPWIGFFSEAVRAQAVDALTRIESLLALRDEFIARLRTVRAKGVSLRIAEELIGYPMITPTLASRRYAVSYQAANTAIARLVELGILTQRTRGRYQRIFASNDVIRIIEN